MLVRLALLAMLCLTAVVHAEDLQSPSGSPWWQRLAECGGIVLAARDAAEAAKAPPGDIAQLTRSMNGFLEAAWGRLMKDRALEETAAKRTVYQTAGAKWQSLHGQAQGIPSLHSACDADLEAFRQLE